MSRGKLTEEQRLEICSLYLSGVSSTKLAVKFNLSKKTISRYLKNNNIKIRPINERNRKYEINDTWLDNIDTEEKTYFLGLMWSDGNVPQDIGSFNIALHEQDRYMLSKISKIFYCGRDVSKIRKDHTSRIKISSQKLAHRLVELGCIPNKSLAIIFPQWLDLELYPHFVRGLLDGDGSIIIGKIRPEVSFTGTGELLESLKEILFRLDIKSNKCKANADDKNTYYLRITGYNNLKKFLDWIYKDATMFLIRKYDKYLQFLELYNIFAETHYTTEEIKNICNLYNSGKTCLEISKLYRLNESRTIKAIIRRYNNSPTSHS